MATGFVDSNRGGTRRASRCWGPANFSPPRRRHRHDEPRTSIWTWWRLHLALHGPVGQAGPSDADRDHGRRPVFGRFGVVRRVCGLLPAAPQTKSRCRSGVVRRAGWRAAAGGAAGQGSVCACRVGGVGGSVQPQILLPHRSWCGSGGDGFASAAGARGGRREHHGGLAAGTAAVDRPIAQGPGAQRRTRRTGGLAPGGRHPGFLFRRCPGGDRPATRRGPGAQGPSGGGTQTCPRTKHLDRKRG